MENIKKKYLKKGLLVLSTVLLVVLVVLNVLNYVKYDTKPRINLDIVDSNQVEANYIYSTSNISRISFKVNIIYYGYFSMENLGQYDLNNAVDVRNFDLTNILNTLVGNRKDKGKITLRLDNSEDGFFVYCSSDTDASKSRDLNQINYLQKLDSFKNFNFKFTAKRANKNKNSFLMLEGVNKKGNIKIEVYMSDIY